MRSSSKDCSASVRRLDDEMKKWWGTLLFLRQNLLSRDEWSTRGKWTARKARHVAHNSGRRFAGCVRTLLWAFSVHCAPVCVHCTCARATSPWLPGTPHMCPATLHRRACVSQGSASGVALCQRRFSIAIAVSSAPDALASCHCVVAACVCQSLSPQASSPWPHLSTWRNLKPRWQIS